MQKKLQLSDKELVQILPGGTAICPLRTHQIAHAIYRPNPVGHQPELVTRVFHKMERGYCGICYPKAIKVIRAKNMGFFLALL